MTNPVVLLLYGEENTKYLPLDSGVYMVTLESSRENIRGLVFFFGV